MPTRPRRTHTLDGTPKLATRRSIAREDRDLRIYQLAASGLSYAKVAQQVGLSKGQVGRIIKKQAQLHSEESLAHARDLILQRAQMVVATHMSQVKNTRSADIILKASDQQARLLGLYEPQQGAGIAEATGMLVEFVKGLEKQRA